MSAGVSVKVRYFRLSEPLQPYFTALYLFDFTAPEGLAIEDYLHPEWTAMRFSAGAPLMGAVGAAPLQPTWPFVITGPTSQAVHFTVRTSCVWGLGLQPAGWARFIGEPASAFVDKVVNGSLQPAFARFKPLLAIATDPGRDQDAIAAAVDAYLLDELTGPESQRIGLVRAVHAALRDPQVANVSEIEDRIGISRRTLERTCARYFGFPPKLELRRQRFLRSLARFMQADGGRWSEALDERYYDQAQFVRDFRAFMRMTPSEYAEMPHPVLGRIMGQRLKDQGVTQQTDLPTTLRYIVNPDDTDK